MQQNTISSPISMSGIGVHSGATVAITLLPAPTGHGIVFKRVDLGKDSNAYIPARYDHVSDTRLCTVLSNDHGIKIGTVEHLLAACASIGIDNLLIEVNSEEIPIFDGSSLPFIEAIHRVGVTRQAASKKFLRILETVEISFPDGRLASLSPSTQSIYHCRLEFAHAVIGEQHYTHLLTPDSFARDIAPARTFGFMHEVEKLRLAGLARGGSLENAVVIGDDKILNPEGLRFTDEFVRHKILDAVGDLSLCGHAIIGRYDAVRPGHALNNALLHALFQQEDAWDLVSIDSKKSVDFSLLKSTCSKGLQKSAEYAPA
ncbi:MAG: UDP-3-O-acyl-N-acetylglucosamine deacetylase [Alphaproteobacteria bacterium]